MKPLKLAKSTCKYRPSPVRQLHRHIEAAFSLPEAPVDAATAERRRRSDILRSAYGQAKAVFRAEVLGGASPLQVGRDLTMAADRVVAGMLELAIAKASSNDYTLPGRFAVMALGKFGGQELALSSDVDLVCVYDASAERSDEAAEAFTRLTQSLIEWLSWSPQWPQTFEVDMRLRPHGQDGPVASSLTGLLDYISHDIWTWELQALTRLRPIAGDRTLIRDIMTYVRARVRDRLPAHDVLKDVAEMRNRLDAEKPADGEWDIKHAVGGLVDIEFIVQGLQLQHVAQIKTFKPNTSRGLDGLRRAGRLSGAHYQRLKSAWTLHSQVRHLQCALGTKDLTGADEAVAAALSITSVDRLRDRLGTARQEVRDLFVELIGAPCGVAVHPVAGILSGPEIAGLRAVASR